MISLSSRLLVCGAVFGLSVPAFGANIGELKHQGYKVVSVTPSVKNDTDFAVFLEKGEYLFVCPLQFKKTSVEYLSGPWTDFAQCTQITPRDRVAK
jgi:hypothetical protein